MTTTKHIQYLENPIQWARWVESYEDSKTLVVSQPECYPCYGVFTPVGFTYLSKRDLEDMQETLANKPMMLMVDYDDFARMKIKEDLYSAPVYFFMSPNSRVEERFAFVDTWEAVKAWVNEKTTFTDCVMPKEYPCLIYKSPETGIDYLYISDLEDLCKMVINEQGFLSDNEELMRSLEDPLKQVARENPAFRARIMGDFELLKEVDAEEEPSIVMWTNMVKMITALHQKVDRILAIEHENSKAVEGLLSDKIVVDSMGKVGVDNFFISRERFISACGDWLIEAPLIELSEMHKTEEVWDAAAEMTRYILINAGVIKE